MDSPVNKRRHEPQEGTSSHPLDRCRGQGESVLVIDDVPELREAATLMLAILGYQVKALASGEEAVEYLTANKADILVLDMIMAPGIDGLETYRRALKINPAQKAILVSGYSETERTREALRLGAGAHLQKPCRLEQLGFAIRRELDR